MLTTARTRDPLRVHTTLPEIACTTDSCQRWNLRQHWLNDALHKIGTIRVRHRGCHRYILAATHAQRRALHARLADQPYPRR